MLVYSFCVRWADACFALSVVHDFGRAARHCAAVHRIVHAAALSRGGPAGMSLVAVVCVCASELRFMRVCVCAVVTVGSVCAVIALLGPRIVSWIDGLTPMVVRQALQSLDSHTPKSSVLLAGSQFVQSTVQAVTQGHSDLARETLRDCLQTESEVGWGQLTAFVLSLLSHIAGYHHHPFRCYHCYGFRGCCGSCCAGWGSDSVC